MGVIAALVAGLLFGAGLIISGMVNPEKVQNFLDIAGDWDPSLAFVIAGAIAVASIGYWLAQRRAKPFAAERFHLPPKWPIGPRLVAGSAIFGVGWGLAGFCPGPALASLAAGASGTALFVAAMLVGIAAGAAVRGHDTGQD